MLCGKKTALAIFTTLSIQNTNKSLLHQREIIIIGPILPIIYPHSTKYGQCMPGMVMNGFIKTVQIHPVYFYTGPAIL